MEKEIKSEIKYFLYCRKSTDEGDRQILSLKSQEEEVIKRFGNFKIIKLPSESVSAFEPYKRPIFKEMMERIQKGEARGIIAWHPDRLSRNPIDAAQIIYLIDRGIIKDLKFCSFNFDNSPEGKMMLSFVLSQSKYSSDKLSKDVKRGMDKKANAGWRPGRAPLGYLNSKIKLKGEQDISKDPERFEVVKQVLRYMLTGNYTMPALLEIVNDRLCLRMPVMRNKPQRKLHLSELHRILINPFYYGWFEWPQKSGNWLIGKHEPMITEREFDRIQLLLGREGRPRPQEHRFDFTGLMRCGSCGSMITAEEKLKKQKNGNTHHYIYYHCTKKKNRNCPEKSIELKEFNRQIDNLLRNLTISEKFNDWAIANLHRLHKQEANTQSITLETKQKELTRITEHLHSLYLKFTSPANSDNQLINVNDYIVLKSQLNKERAAIEVDLQNQGLQLEEWLDLGERTFNFARYAQIWFAKGDSELRRAIFSSLGSNLVVTNKKISISLRKPFKIIIDRLPLAITELQELEPLKMPINTGLIPLLPERFPILSG